MAGKLQNEDFKTSAQIISAGGTTSQLLNDTKIYVTGSGLNKTLYAAITDGNLGSGGSTYTKAAMSGNKTALTTEDFIYYTGSGGHTLTLYAASAQTKPLTVANMGTGDITIVRASSDTIIGETSQTLIPNASVMLISDGTSKFAIN